MIEHNGLELEAPPNCKYFIVIDGIDYWSGYDDEYELAAIFRGGNGDWLKNEVICTAIVYWLRRDIQLFKEHEGMTEKELDEWEQELEFVRIQSKNWGSLIDGLT